MADEKQPVSPQSAEEAAAHAGVIYCTPGRDENGVLTRSDRYYFGTGGTRVDLPDVKLINGAWVDQPSGG